MVKNEIWHQDPALAESLEESPNFALPVQRGKGDTVKCTSSVLTQTGRKLIEKQQFNHIIYELSCERKDFNALKKKEQTDYISVLL